MTFVDIWHLFKSLLLALYEKTAHTVSNQKEKVQFFCVCGKTTKKLMGLNNLSQNLIGSGESIEPLLFVPYAELPYNSMQYHEID